MIQLPYPNIEFPPNSKPTPEQVVEQMVKIQANLEALAKGQ